MSEPVPFTSGDPTPSVSFCSYCATRPGDGMDESSRVCLSCNMGLLLRAPEGAAPDAHQAFLVVDDLLKVRGLSRTAERLLHVTETAAIDRSIGAILEVADAPEEPFRGSSFTAALASATHGGAITEMALRLQGSFGVRWWARIAPCAPGRAALVTLVDRL
jgi:hypothetical protein